MRTILLVILAVGAVIYGIFQRGAVADRDAVIARLTSELSEARAERQKAAAEVATVQQEAVVKEENVARLTAERDAARAKAKEVAVGEPSAAPEKSGETSPAQGFKAFAKMFETDEGKKMMKSQMRMVTQMQYGDLAKDLGLSPDDAEQLMALLSDRQGELAAESFKSMSAGNEDGGAGLAAKAEAVQKDYEQKLKAVLGEERFGQFQEYEKTIGERVMLAQFEPQFAAAGAPLAKPQRDQLLQIMGDERRKMPPQVFDTSGQSPAKGLAALQDDAAVERFFQQESEYHRRVLAAAPKALSPDQVNALQKSFQQIAEMQKFGIKMNREMFKNTGGSPTPAAPVVEAE